MTAVAATGFFPLASLKRLRALRARKRTASCTVQRRTTVIGAGGAKTQTWADVPGLTNLACGFAPAAAPSETIAADAARAQLVYEVDFDVEAFPAGAESIKPEDRLVVTHAVRGLPSPATLSVIDDTPEASDEIGRVVRATRVRTGGV